MSRQFRWAFLAYLLLPTILLIVKITVLTWRFEWVAEILRETLVLYIYVHVGVTFRPTKRLTFEDVSALHPTHVSDCILTAGIVHGARCDPQIRLPTATGLPLSNKAHGASSRS